MPPLDLVKYEQKIAIVEAGTVYRINQYDGADPLLTRQQKTLKIVTQSGTAIAWKKRFNPPAAIFPNNLIEQFTSDHERLDACHWQISWHYVMAVLPGETVPVETSCKPPTNPTFTEVT
jgi:hypothetical protein